MQKRFHWAGRVAKNAERLFLKLELIGSIKRCNECDFARKAVVVHLIEKTGNIAAVQRQLGHTNAAYSIQYARVTDQELADALDDR